ncbi:hypothetical protein [Streptomyces gardneri]|uniref:hypothetical protein n=1 Tax=Streptomyces gardneri TaxID=66892 RepID=UPI0033C49D96
MRRLVHLRVARHPRAGTDALGVPAAGLSTLRRPGRHGQHYCGGRLVARMLTEVVM